MSQIPAAETQLSRPRSVRRLAVAAVATALTIGVAGAFGGVHAAFAGAGGLAHVAAQTIAPSKGEVGDPSEVHEQEGQ